MRCLRARRAKALQRTNSAALPTALEVPNSHPAKVLRGSHKLWQEAQIFKATAHRLRGQATKVVGKEVAIVGVCNWEREVLLLFQVQVQDPGWLHS